ncbi:hypothetical protein B0H19DRAFT_1236028 [Mycena capillaripes]|nr:hypothetical protein B0H19DRAFT_1236028 [Mycena capillaripes]
MVKSRWKAQECALRSTTLLGGFGGSGPDPATVQDLDLLRRDGVDFVWLNGKKSSDAKLSKTFKSSTKQSVAACRVEVKFFFLKVEPAHAVVTARYQVNSPRLSVGRTGFSLPNPPSRSLQKQMANPALGFGTDAASGTAAQFHHHSPLWS